MTRANVISDFSTRESSWNLEFERSSPGYVELRDIPWNVNYEPIRESQSWQLESLNVVRSNKLIMNAPKKEALNWIIGYSTVRYVECPMIYPVSSTNVSIVPVPTDLSTLFLDLTKKSGALVVSDYNNIHDSIAMRKIDSQLLDRLDNMQLLFGLAKKGYSKTTLNYEVFSGIQEDLVEIKNSLEKSNFDNAFSLSKDLLEDFQLMSDTLKELRKAGLNLSLVEDTGETIGGMRVFRMTS